MRSYTQGAIADGAEERDVSPPPYSGERNEKVRRTILLLAAMGTALLLSSGVALALNVIKCGSEEPCHGTDRPDLMKGTDGFNFMLGHGNDDALKGFGRSDELFGQEGDDRLLGGRGQDFVVGGKGDDTLRGEETIDGYFFERSKWGQDSIIEDAPSRNFLALPFAENLSGPVTTNLNSDSGPTPEVTNAQSGSTVNWEGNVITFVSGSSGDDTVTGNDASNGLYDDAGPVYGTAPDTDAISAGGGNDFIVVQDGDSSDTVNCGGGSDYVISDETEVLIADDCEENDTGGPMFPEAMAAESASGGNLSEFRSFQAP